MYRRVNEVQEHINKDDVSIPYFIQFDRKFHQIDQLFSNFSFFSLNYFRRADINSAFVELSFYLATNNLPAHLLAYTSVFLESFFSLPINKSDGTQIPFEDVVRQLNEDTVDFSATLGIDSLFMELMAVSMKAEVSVNKYIQ